MNRNKKREETMYFISESEYIYLPLLVLSKTYRHCTINKNKNQIFYLNFRKNGVMHHE